MPIQAVIAIMNFLVCYYIAKNSKMQGENHKKVCTKCAKIVKLKRFTPPVDKPPFACYNLLERWFRF